jgi:hypothetical protein
LIVKARSSLRVELSVLVPAFSQGGRVHATVP